MEHEPLSPDSGRLIAAVDLGSNSFHMVVARVEHGEARPVERLAEPVQLAAGMVDGRLGAAAMSRGLECLARFRQALDALSPGDVRVVGTNSLRVAGNGAEFSAAAGAVIGHPVEVIPGREEARLVYLGVAHTLADDDARLVVDIGGGSTEFIIGERFEPRLMESLHMGCVSYAERFFAGGVISRKAFDSAYFTAYGEVLNIRSAFRELGWSNAVGSSGTLRALENIIVVQGWADAGITAANLARLRKLLFSFKHVRELSALAGLSERRRNVFASGLAIACAFFEALQIEQMRTSTGALREGVIYDMIGRHSHEDVRGRSVNALMQRYAVDEANARRVEDTARHLFASVRDEWGFGAGDLDLLAWAARLHDVGLAISHSHFHKHGQYLVECSDLPGFSTAEQVELGLLIRGHRQKFPLREFEAGGNGKRPALERLCLLLRLAVLFKFIAPVEGEPPYQLTAKDRALTLSFPRGWLQAHPLTRHLLVAEQSQLTRIGYTLTFARSA
ncbi:MAG: Ppx/GppA phosphatase family protein [Porticoccaceae bacterium]|jgi:exopolyphosphatase/guanosine-5'-triphosphate,3'-diphosphate pyrophosphatase